MNHIFTFFTCLLLTLAAAQAASAAEPASRPNIVVILSDDFGWGSLGCYGAPPELKTPNLDRLAREGRRFTHAYAPGSVCSPTRYGVMTGRYYWRTSVKDGEVLAGNAPLHIETDRITLASLCQDQGYRTAAFGKWHLGLGSEARRTEWSGELKPGPLEIGFDYFFGLASNPWSGPHSFIENHEVLGKIPGEAVVVSGAREDATTSGLEKTWKEDEIVKTLTEKVVGWLDQQKPGQPFFLYYAPNAVHRPIAPNPKFTGSIFGSYGDFIHELDWSVGEVLAALDRGNLAENTLVIFTSDNGGVANEQKQDSISEARDQGLLVNNALRGGKHDVWEGGFREPFLVRWPGKAPAGTVSEQVICLTDLLATVAGILEVPLPKEAAEDSFDVGRAITETEPGPPVRDHVILQAADAAYAIRMGDWKLVERVGAPEFAARNKKRAEQAARKAKSAPQDDELFNLQSDPAEADNVIAANAEQASRMKTLLQEVRQRGHSRLAAKGQAPPRPRLQIINGSTEPIEVFWVKSDTERVSNGRIAPGKDEFITTTLGHRFAIVGCDDHFEESVTCLVPIQSFRFDPKGTGGVPSFYTQRIEAHRYPIVASAAVNPYALKEAAYLVDLMLAKRPDVREAMINSGSRLCILAWNEFTTDQPEFAWLAEEPRHGISGKDYMDARARGLGGSTTDPLCSCAEENLLCYPGDPYSTENILIHEFAHNIHLRGMTNVDPTFDRRLKKTYEDAMQAGLWRTKYASVNHHEYFAEGVQSWFDNNRENDHDHNHVNTREELVAYDPGLAALCREVFGDTELKYTKPTTRLSGHMAGYDPASAPTFVWPERLKTAKAVIRQEAESRGKGGK